MSWLEQVAPTIAAAIGLRKNEAQHYFSVMKKIKDKGHSVCLWEF